MLNIPAEQGTLIMITKNYSLFLILSMILLNGEVTSAIFSIHSTCLNKQKAAIEKTNVRAGNMCTLETENDVLPPPFSRKMELMQ